jgi:TldD protein
MAAGDGGTRDQQSRVPLFSTCPLCARIDPADLRAAMTVALRRGGWSCEVYVEHRDSRTVRGDDRWAEARTDRDIGAAVRVIGGATAGLSTTNVLTRAGLGEAAEIAAAAAGSDSAGSRHAAQLVERRTAPAQRARDAEEWAEASTAADLVRRAALAARSIDRRVRSVTVTLVEVSQHVVVAGSDGRLVRDARTRTRMTCRVVARADDRVQTGFAGPGIGGGLELFADEPPEAIGRRAAERAIRGLDGVEVPSGATAVVLGPAAGGLFLHEACGHGLEADGLTRGTSIFARTAGHRLARNGVTAVDEPALAGGFGSYAIDDEGEQAERTVLIDAGVQTGALSDRAESARLGMPPSANGRRESYAHAPLCRMSNTFIEPGADSAADILADVAHGVYISTLSGGDVDITTGDFAFTASEAHVIERGSLARPIAGATILGNGAAALAAIDAVGGDLAFTQAMCGKGGQWVPVSYGSPTLRIPGLTVTGG